MYIIVNNGYLVHRHNYICSSSQALPMLLPPVPALAGAAQASPQQRNESSLELEKDRFCQ